MREIQEKNRTLTRLKLLLFVLLFSLHVLASSSDEFFDHHRGDDDGKAGLSLCALHSSDWPFKCLILLELEERAED